MRHPCEPSEYQFNYGRTYLRGDRGGRGSGDSRPSTTTSHPPRACRDSFPIPNRDLDLMFGVPEVNRPAEFLARVKYDTVTGEVISVDPVSGSTPVKTVSRPTSSTKPEMLEEKLVLNSFTRHGYNVEHIKGPVSGPLPDRGKVDGEHSDYADMALKTDIEQLQEFQRDTIEDKKIIMGAIMELEEKLNELRSGHSHQIDDLLINQGQIRKSIEEQIQIIHRIQLSDFENATLKIQDIQSKLQEQILTQAEDFR
eukprot:sb/3468636/